MWSCALSTILASLLGFGHASGGIGVPDDSGLRYSARQGWSIENGLPQNSIRDLLQSRDGALWIATFGGLARFDGHEFEIFNAANTPELGSSFLRRLLEDSHGRLWIGSAEGSVACRTGKSFRGYGYEQGVPRGDVWDIVELPDGRILIGGQTGILELRGGRFVPFVDDPRNLLERVARLHVDADSTVWCAAFSGLYRIRDGAIVRIADPGQPDYTWAGYVGRMPEIGLLVQTSVGLATVDGDRLRHLKHIDGPPEFRIWSALHNPDGGVILATGSAMWIVRIENGTAYFTPNSKKDADVSALLRDREDNLWIGHLQQGLLQLIRTPTSPLDFEGLRMERGNVAFAAAGDFAAWLASSEDSSVLRVDLDSGQAVGMERLPYSTTRVLGLLTTADGSLWIHHDQGLRIVKGEDILDRDVQVPAYASPMLQDSHGAVWIGGRGALVRVDDAGAQRLGSEVGFSENFEVTSLAESRDGALWIGMVDSVGRLANGQLTTWTRADGLPGGIVRTLLARPDGSVWLGTYGGGLARWKDGEFVRVDGTRGLYSDAVSRIEVDDQDNFWINSNRGVFRVRCADLEDVADGRAEALACLALRTRESGGLGGVRLGSGLLLFATTDGIVVIDPKTITQQQVPPGIEIKRWIADGVAHEPVGDMIVPPGPRELVFRFAGLSLTEPDAVRYRYRLDGFDPAWRDGGGEGSARYTNVPPGDYRFEVLARSYDGTWSQSPAAVDLTLEPYFYETIWFRLSVLVLILSSIVMAFDRRARAAERRQRALQREVDLRTLAEESLRRLTGRLIRAQEAERRRVALELHDDLGQRLALLGVSLDMLAENPRARAADGMSIELHDLSDSVKSIASDVHGISHRLHSTKLDKLGLRAAVQSLCKEMSGQHKIAVEFQCSDDGVEPAAEVALGLYRIAQEAVRNAVRHGEASAIHVEIEADGAWIRLAVADDGKGFDRQASQRHVGLGLQGMRERVRLVGGTLELTSTPGKGTRIVAAIPLSESAGIPAEIDGFG
jgi:signal transduction histidine kinase/ligand-binding sensor domain-containing protein